MDGVQYIDSCWPCRSVLRAKPFTVRKRSNDSVQKKQSLSKWSRCTLSLCRKGLAPQTAERSVEATTNTTENDPHLRSLAGKEGPTRCLHTIPTLSAADASSATAAAATLAAVAASDVFVGEPRPSTAASTPQTSRQRADGVKGAKRHTCTHTYLLENRVVVRHRRLQGRGVTLAVLPRNCAQQCGAVGYR